MLDGEFSQEGTKMSETHKFVCRTGKVDAEMRAWADMLMPLGDKWTVLVFGSLTQGPQRYNQLNRLVTGISQRMLTLTLKRLERDGLISRTVTPTIPPQVEYDLTPLGQTLSSSLAVLWAWAAEHRHAVETARQAFDEQAEAPINTL